MASHGVFQLNKHTFFLSLAFLFLLYVLVVKHRSILTGSELPQQLKNTTSRTYPPSKYTLGVRKRINQLLENVQDNTTMRNTRSRFFAVPQHRLATCDIDKVMSTVLVNVNCYLYNETLFHDRNNTITGTWWSERACQTENEAWGYEYLKSIIPVDRNSIAVVRDPIDRFISSFTDKCINELPTFPENCFGCNGDINCFIEKLPPILNNIGTEDPDIDSTAKLHFSPQVWFCDLSMSIDDMHFIQFNSKNAQEQTIKPLLEIFKFIGVSEHQLDYLQESFSKPTVHTTSGSDTRARIGDMIANNQTLYNILVDIYALDYAVFEFPLPSRVFL